MADYKKMPYKPGDYLAVCDRCDFVYYGSQLRRDWRGNRVCDKCYEPKHPQLNVRPIKETSAVAAGTFRPEPADTFLSAGDVTATSLSPATVSIVQHIKDGALLVNPTTSGLWTAGSAWTWTSGVYTRVPGSDVPVGDGVELITDDPDFDEVEGNGNLPHSDYWSWNKISYRLHSGSSPAAKTCVAISDRAFALNHNNLTPTIAQKYVIQFTLYACADVSGCLWTSDYGDSGEAIRVNLGGASSSYYNSDGVKTTTLTATTTGSFGFSGTADLTHARRIFVDSISVQKWVRDASTTAADTVTQDGSDMYDEPEEDSFYKLIFTMTRTAGTLTPSLGGTDGTERSSSDTYTEYIKCGSDTDDLVFSASDTFAGTLSNIQLYSTTLVECP